MHTRSTRSEIDESARSPSSRRLTAQSRTSCTRPWLSSLVRQPSKISCAWCDMMCALLIIVRPRAAREGGVDRTKSCLHM